MGFFSTQLLITRSRALLETQRTSGRLRANFLAEVEQRESDLIGSLPHTESAYSGIGVLARWP